MSGSELVRQLKELAELHTSGAISADEFAMAKARLLRWVGPPSTDQLGGRDDVALAVDRGRPIDPSTPEHAPAQVDSTSERPPYPSESAPQGHIPAKHDEWLVPRPEPGESVTPTRPRDANWIEPPPDPRLALPLQSSPGLPPHPIGRMQPSVRAAPLTVLAGGVLTLLAFLTMPVATVPFFGSITGANLAGLATETGTLAMLWLVPLAAAGVAGISAWQLFAQSVPPLTRRRGSFIVLPIVGVVVLIYLIGLAAIQSELSRSGASGVGISASSLTGAGFWFALLGMFAAGAAAVADLLGLKPASGPAGPDASGP